MHRRAVAAVELHHAAEQLRYVAMRGVGVDLTETASIPACPPGKVPPDPTCPNLTDALPHDQIADKAGVKRMQDYLVPVRSHRIRPAEPCEARPSKLLINHRLLHLSGLPAKERERRLRKEANFLRLPPPELRYSPFLAARSKSIWPDRPAGLVSWISSP
jgi:hypothetical protein